jgi:hypothetical protein
VGGGCVLTQPEVDAGGLQPTTCGSRPAASLAAAGVYRQRPLVQQSGITRSAKRTADLSMVAQACTRTLSNDLGTVYVVDARDTAAYYRGYSIGRAAHKAWWWLLGASL